MARLSYLLQFKRVVLRAVAPIIALLLGCSVASADQNVNVVVGTNVTMSAIADGTPPFTYQWKKNGADIGGATGSTLSIPNSQGSDSGTYTVVIANPLGSILSEIVTLGVGSVPPSAGVQPTSQTVGSGTAVSLTFTASGAPIPTIQWFKDGVAVPGATSSTLYFSSVTSANSGTYTAVATNYLGSVTSSPAVLRVLVPSRLVNVSTRAGSASGSQTLIAGFVINGGAKSILVRAVGPGIASYFSPGTVLADPQLTIRAGDTVVASNDNWGGSTTLKDTFTRLGAFALPDDASKDAALLTSLNPNTPYSGVVSSGATGLAIVEVYDADQGDIPAGRLVNLSTRTFVGTDVNVLIAGFVISGDYPKQVLIRAIGPTLASYGVTGVLADPKLELYTAGGTTPIQTNDNWGGSASLVSVFNQVGAFALPDAASKDAVLLVTLNPGAYSAIVSGVGNTTGVALIEVYDVQ